MCGVVLKEKGLPSDQVISELKKSCKSTRNNQANLLHVSSPGTDLFINKKSHLYSSTLLSKQCFGELSPLEIRLVSQFIPFSITYLSNNGVISRVE